LNHEGHEEHEGKATKQRCGTVEKIAFPSVFFVAIFVFFV
jgi:hypothetical protein